jgi:hypothetical protein
MSGVRCRARSLLLLFVTGARIALGWAGEFQIGAAADYRLSPLAEKI